MTLYMAVEKSEYELPVFVETNICVLAQKLDASVATIKSCMARSSKGITKGISCKGYNMYRVVVEDDEDDED